MLAINLLKCVPNFQPNLTSPRNPVYGKPGRTFNAWKEHGGIWKKYS